MNLAPVDRRINSNVDALCEGRDNNFNLLRMIAATLVVFTHAFGVTGNGNIEPLLVAFGISLGGLAVNVFFVSSGFLIAKSWDRSRSWKRFLWARFIRIYPALWVCVFFCVFVVGISFTSLSAREYLLNVDTFKFVAENSTLVIRGVFTTLPGTFVGIGNESVNTPLWTLPYELKMYFLLLLLGVCGLLYRRGVVAGMLAACLLLHIVTCILGQRESALAEYARFTFFFFSGSYFYLKRTAIELRTNITVALLTTLCASLLLPDVAYRSIVLSVATPYLVLYFALVPAGWMRMYNRVGDFSYGLYVYGFPVQMSVLALAGGSMSIGGNFAIAWMLASTTAAFSWYLVERQALAISYDQVFRRNFRASACRDCAPPS